MRGLLLAWAFVSAAFAAYVLFAFMGSSYYQRLYRIRANQATVRGFEIGVNCDDRALGFAYVVDGKTYLWRKSFTDGLPRLVDRLAPAADSIGDCANNVGAAKVVYYEANRPTNSIAEEPTRLIVGDFIFCLAAAILVPLSFLLSLRNGLAQRKSRRGALTDNS